MRALHVSAYFAPAYAYGGPPRSVLGLCRALRQAGVDVVVFTTTANGDQARLVAGERRVDGVPVHYFPWTVPRRSFGAAGMRAALAQAVDAFDIVHVHGVWHVPGGLATRFCRKKSIPYVVSPRGMLDAGSFAHHRLRKELFFRFWERASLESAALLHASSSKEAQELSARLPHAKVVVVPNGVAPPEGVAGGGIRRRRDLGSGPLVVFLGRLHPTKRLDLLLAAFRLVLRSAPGARLVLAGPEDGVVASDLAGELLGNEVVWLGHLEDEERWALLVESSVLVLCSDSESFGVSVLEALSVGVPVVVSRSCPWEEVESRGCGFWVEQQPEAIRRGIVDILGDAAGAQRMGTRGRQLVAERYQWPVIGRIMAAHYHRLLRDREPPGYGSETFLATVEPSRAPTDT